MCLYKALISGERLQDHWSSGFRLDSSVGTHRCARKRVYHECEVLILKSVPRVTV